MLVGFSLGCIIASFVLLAIQMPEQALVTALAGINLAILYVGYVIRYKEN